MEIKNVIPQVHAVGMRAGAVASMGKNIKSFISGHIPAVRK